MTVSEKVHFGRPGDFMTVRQLTVRGSNFEIGRALGSIAVDRYGKTADDLAASPVFARARRRYIQQVFPAQWQRMLGIADAFGIDPENDHYDLTHMGHLIDFPPGFGCSVVYYPPASTASGTGVLSRNYDFSIDSLPAMFGIPDPEGAEPSPEVMSEPYIMEWYPTDGGLASVAIHAFDTLAGTLDGLNSAGLAVSILADNEGMGGLGANWEPHVGAQQVVGLHELAVMRLLLDTCESVEQAKDALLTVKQYYRFQPCHYIVADRDGNSFVYENSTGRNVQHIIDGGGEPQIASNFQLYRHPSFDTMPDGPITMENEAFWRYRALSEQIASQESGFDIERIKAINACVNTQTLIEKLSGDQTPAAAAATAVRNRTVWHSLYDQHSGTMSASFYLGEHAAEDGSRKERFSDYLTVSLHNEPLTTR